MKHSNTFWIECSRVGRVCPQRAGDANLQPNGALRTDAPCLARLSPIPQSWQEFP
jgi:hypothetical protein